MERDYIQRPVDEAYRRGIEAMNQPASGSEWLEAVAKTLTGMNLQSPVGGLGTIRIYGPEPVKYLGWADRNFPSLFKKFTKLGERVDVDIAPPGTRRRRLGRHLIEVGDPTPEQPYPYKDLLAGILHVIYNQKASPAQGPPEAFTTGLAENILARFFKGQRGQ